MMDTPLKNLLSPDFADELESHALTHTEILPGDDNAILIFLHLL